MTYFLIGLVIIAAIFVGGLIYRNNQKRIENAGVLALSLPTIAKDKITKIEKALKE